MASSRMAPQEQKESYLVCEWIENEEGGDMCAMAFSDFTTLFSHVLDHLSSSDPGPCKWSTLCQYHSPVQVEYKNHVLFHSYHSLLKQKGLEYQESKGLPPCQLSSDDSDSIPLINEMKCQWNMEDGVICNLVFDNPVLYYAHVKDHAQSQRGNKKCNWLDCSYEATTSSSHLIDHLKVHTQEKVISCSTCGLLFSNNTKYQDHLQRQAPPTSSAHSCSICKKCFSTERLLKEHIRKHINTQQCPYCAMTCTSHSALLYHMTYRHSENKPYQCPLCQKNYKTEYSLTGHMETHKERSFPCSESHCTYVGKSLKSLQRHLRVDHVQCLTYCCHICNNKFGQGMLLTNHLKRAHGFKLPPGHSRFRYIMCDDGYRRLQTVRLDEIAPPPPT